MDTNCTYDSNWNNLLNIRQMKYKWNQLENKMYDFTLAFMLILLTAGIIVDLIRKF